VSALAAGGLAITGFVVTGAAEPAWAALGDCQVTAGCMWFDNSYKGTRKQFVGCIDDFAIYGADNAASSVYNRGTSGQNVYFYSGKNATGSRLILQKNYGVRMLSDYGWDNAISSGYFSGRLKDAGTIWC
jgi:hypothetical protein